MGSLISQDQLDTVDGPRRRRRRQGRPGAHRRAGTGPTSAPYFYEPTILEGVTPDMACFGDGDLRPGRLGLPLPRRGRRDRPRQRGRVRPERLDLHPGRRAGAGDRPRRSSAAPSTSTRRSARPSAASTPRWAACASPGSAAARAPRASSATPRRRPSATQRLIRFAPMLGMSDADLREGDDRQPAADEEAGPARDPHFDVLVVGSGFGGSVTALRLTEKGYRVGVLEAGAGSPTTTSPRPPSTPERYLFRPEVGCYGIQRIDVAQGLPDPGRRGRRRRLAGLRQHALRAAAPPSTTTRRGATSPTGGPSWRRTTTRPSGCSASSTNPLRTPADEVMQQVADEMGVGDTFRPTPGGRLLRRPGPDAGRHRRRPVLRRRGPDRNPCRKCGECMTGCRHNAKNTLVKNYLHLAEKAGAEVHPLTTVTRIAPARRTVGTTSTCRYTKAKLRRRDGDPACSPPTRSCSPPRRSAPSGCCTG